MTGINWTVVLVALIGAVPSTIAAVNSWLGRKQSERNAEKLNKVEKDVNGKMEKLVEAAKELSHANGHAAGIEHERKRNGEKKEA